MKLKYNSLKYIAMCTLAGNILLTSCSNDDFLTTPSEDSYTLENFYNTNAEVAQSTNSLYGKVWFNYYNKAYWAITEMGSGNAFSYSEDVTSFRKFEVFGTNESVEEAWKSNFAVIAQANMLIKYLPTKVGSNVSQTSVDNAVGEARMMRALAYFNLVRLWGPVPIIEDNEASLANPQMNTNYEEDLYQFIENDLNYAIGHITNVASSGHGSANSAKALLAKVYLYQKKYTEAKNMAKEVIDSGEFGLMDKYGDLFLTSNNNNKESILAVQWAVTGAYGTGNNCNTMFAYSSEINASTFGGVFAPSMDLMQNGFSEADLRRKETYMKPGDYYQYILASSGGFTVPENINAQNTGSGIKKYVVGKAADNAGGADEWGMMANNTYIMRYADVLLIYSEAILGDKQSTSDAQAVSTFNQVLSRAGLPSVTSFTKEDLLKQRRAEFAFEGEYWFDLCRLPRAEAISIISSQNRGDKNYGSYFTPKESDFKLPYPDADVAKNPKLKQTPVHYSF